MGRIDNAPRWAVGCLVGGASVRDGAMQGMDLEFGIMVTDHLIIVPLE